MEFEIKSECGYSLLFHSQVYSSSGWLDYYSVTINAPAMQATIQVDNAPYGTSPASFFEHIANEWRGWKGEKTWGALEGEFELSATADSTGHVTLTAVVYSGTCSSCSKMQSEFEIEAGQFEKIKLQSLKFFK